MYYDPDDIKICSKCGFKGKATEFRKGRNVCKKCKSEYDKKYLEENRNAITQYRVKNYTEHREEFIEFQRNYRKNNKEIIAFRFKIKYEANPLHKLDINRKYASSPKGKIAKKKKFNIRRKLGYTPINSNFKSSHFHHMYLGGDKAIGIHIPEEIHKSRSHNGKTGEGMREINKAALLWLCEQSVIN